MSMEERSGVIWVDGRLVPWSTAHVHLLSYTFQHGAGFFEGVRAYEGKTGTSIFRLDAHVERFFGSAKILQMQLPFSQAELRTAHIDVIKVNGLKSCYLRPMGYYDGKVVGVSASGNDVHAAIAAWEWNDYLGAEAKQRGVRVKTSTFSRHHVNSTMGKAKANGHYINSMLAIMEARQQGFQDALLLDAQGYVAECSTSNIFIYRGGRLITPDITNVLEGITRDTIIVLAAELGFEVHERRITRDEIYCAEEMFITGTAAEVTPVIELDNRIIGSGSRGPVTHQLQLAYQRAVEGSDGKDRNWLTHVA